MAAQVNVYLYPNAFLSSELFGAWKLADIYQIKALLNYLMLKLFWQDLSTPVTWTLPTTLGETLEYKKWTACAPIKATGLKHYVLKKWYSYGKHVWPYLHLNDGWPVDLMEIHRI